MVPSRRQILQTTSVLVAGGLAGCLTSTGQSDTDTDTIAATETDSAEATDRPSPMQTDSSPTPNGIGAKPARSCKEGYTSIDPWFVVEGPGPLGRFDLSVKNTSISLGGTLTATLTNVTEQTQLSGTKQKFDIQFNDGSTWRTVFGLPEVHNVWSDIGIEQPPSEGFAWELTFTRDGLTDPVDGYPEYHPCGPLTDGTYRFVYWGITTEQGEKEDFETTYALGVPFTVTQD